MKRIKPLSSQQLISFQESNAKINIWQGAVRSGKTYSSIVRFLDEVLNGPAGDYAILTKTYDTFRRNILSTLTEIIGVDARYYMGKREMIIWGKRIFIIGCDDRGAESKIRGATFGGAYVDEATEIPDCVFRMLISRTMIGDARIFATTNPSSPYHWLKTEFLDNNPDVLSWAFVLDDNPLLTKDEKDYLKRQYKGIWYKRYIEGLWVQAEGAIYDFFDVGLHAMDYPTNSAEYYICGVDYGTTNACAFVMLGVNRSAYPNIWVEKEYYYDSRVKQRQKTDSEYADDLERFIAGKPVKAIYIDPSAASFKLELQRRGVQSLMDANNEVIDGIRFVGDCINNGTLKVVKSCVNLLKEIQSYVWDERSFKTGVDKPIKENDHALDALRYAMFTHFYNKNTDKIDWDKVYRDAHQLPPNLPRFFQDPIDGNSGFGHNAMGF